jgi:cobaltochelatase CobS
MNTKELVVKWNELKGKGMNVDSASLNQFIGRRINEFGESVVLEAMEKTTETNIYLALSSWNIANLIREKMGVKPIPMDESIKDKIKGMTFSMLAEAISDSAGASKFDMEEVLAKVDDYIKAKYGDITARITYTLNDKVILKDEIVHDEFQTVVQFVKADEPVMLVGPAGTGKNVLVHQVAKALNLQFYFSNAITEEYKLTGFIDAMGKYHETEFYRAFTKGGLFMLDEIDASIPETLVILNAAIANRYFDFPHVGRVKAHSDFRIIAAGNTYGTGASYQYVGRNQLDGASLNRFAIVEINYDKKIENSISSDSELVAFIRNFRKAVEKNGINHIVSYRELGRLDKMIRVGMEITKALKSCLIKNLKQDELKIIINSLPDRENKYKGDLQKCVE